jgi:hypothetical protein
MSVALHGVRVFKALVFVHATLQDGRPTTSAADENARDEFKFWMDTIVHDVKYQPEGERGLLSHTSSGNKWFLTCSKGTENSQLCTPPT